MDVLLGSPLDIVVISETWLTEDDPDSLLSHNSQFNVFRCDRMPGMGHGGVALLVKSHIMYSASVSKPFNFYCETLYVDLVFKNSFCFRIIAVYRKPGTNAADTATLFDSIAEWSTTEFPVIVVGDFNLPNMSGNHSSSQTVNALEQFIIDNSFINFVTAPTRFNNTLDLLLSNDLSLVKDCKVLENFSTSDQSIAF